MLGRANGYKPKRGLNEKIRERIENVRVEHERPTCSLENKTLRRIFLFICSIICTGTYIYSDSSLV